MRTVFLTLIVLLHIFATDTEACGRRCRCRAARAWPVSRVPVYPAARRAGYQMAPLALGSPVMAPTPTYTPAAPALATSGPAVAVGPVQPAYTYQATPGGDPAYYYTYNDSGELIVKQWMDWLFRGGKEAGMPRPPLPIIGRLSGR